MFESVLCDRRAFPRLACTLPLRISDYHFEWEAQALSLGNGGVFVDTRQDFVNGQDIEVTLIDEELGGEVALEAQVRWCRHEGLGPHGVGVTFLERRTERLEILHDLVDRLAVADVETAARFRAAGEPLPTRTVLYVSRSAPRNPVLVSEERAFLACIDGHTSLAKIQEEMPPEEFSAISFAAFSLMAKGVITPHEGHGLKSAPRAIGSRQRQKTPLFMGGNRSRRQTQARNSQAQAYYQQALEALRGNDKRKAHTLLSLALQLAPGDPEITAALDTVRD